MSADQRGLCRRGQFCADRHEHGGPAPADRALCHRDEDELGRVLRELPEQLANLRADMLAPLPGRPASERTAGGDVEAPLPFRADLDEFQRWFVALVVQWAGFVARVANVPGPPPGERLQGRALAAAVAILRPRITVLLALQPHAVWRRTPDHPDGEAVYLDGGDGALEIFDAHHRARAILGRTRRTRLLPYTCRNLECGVKSLELDPDSKPDVRCSSCGQTSRLDDYETVESA